MTKGRYINLGNKKAGFDRFFNLLWALVTREIKGQYRRSFLGPAWALLQPLFYMVIFTFVRGVLKISSEGIPYVLFTYSALVPWTFFSNAVARCGPSVIQNAGVVKKMALPRIVFPTAAVVTSLFDLLMSGIILIGMMFWFHIRVGWSLIWLPVLVLLMALLALGVGMVIAAFGTYKRDIVFATPFLMQFWLLATPIMYPLGSVPERWQKLYMLNPMVGLIEGFRGALIKGAVPDLNLIFFSLLGIAMVWTIVWPVFRSMSQYFADVL
ncbi:MAG: ABC transporter permease [Deltaproteobacteria bacterium]|nr:MAG: ABC transporter permease [Deltaproteobacteria bacterium]